MRRITHRLPCELRAIEKGNVLVVAPHMDDEVIGGGGTLALHRQAGSVVSVVFCASGTNAEVTRVRKEEARAAAGIMGFADLAWLDQPDGSLSTHEPAIARELARIIQERRPDQIFCPYPTDHHKDHSAATMAVADALRLTSYGGSVWCYEVWSPLWPNVAIDISKVMAIKRDAIAAHRSQVAGVDYVEGILGLNRYRGLRFYVPYAEVFYVCRAAELQRLAAEMNTI